MLRRLLLFVFIFWGTAFLLSAQKSKVIGTFQLIENEKYEEAKGIIEDATKVKSTRNWARTWYARGLLCQNAYRKGIKKNNKDLYELYSDQLYVAYSSFERTRHLDKHGRYDKLLSPKYVLLANDFSDLGKKHFNDAEFQDAFRAFEYALRITKSTVLTIQTDTNLLYNTALSAYKSQEWDDALRYLNELNSYQYSSNIPHLIFAIYIMQSDTAKAQNILLEGIQNYENNEQLVLLLADLFFKQNNSKNAINVLNDAFKKDSTNYTYPYTIGLLFQKKEDYNKAIEAYKSALTLPSDTLKLYTSIGNCYYNMGAEMDQRARVISNNAVYLEKKEKSVAAFESAIEWYEKAIEIDSNKKEITSKLILLYKALGKKEKLIILESMLQ